MGRGVPGNPRICAPLTRRCAQGAAKAAAIRTRHNLCAVIGLMMVLYAFGWEVFHAIFSSTVSFLLMHGAPRKHVHVIVTVLPCVCACVCGKKKNLRAALSSTRVLRGKKFGGKKISCARRALNSALHTPCARFWPWENTFSRRERILL